MFLALMGSFLMIILSVVTAVVAHDSPLSGLAIVNAVGSIWSNGVLLNYSQPGQSSYAPDWSAVLSMLTFVGSLGLLLGSALV